MTTPPRTDARARKAPAAPPDTIGTTYRALIDDAADTADLPGACQRAGVTLARLRRAAAAEPALAAELDQLRDVLRLAALDQVEAAAAAGDLRAVRALASGALDRLDPAHGQPDGPNAAQIAAALVAAHGPGATPWPTVHHAARCPLCTGWLDLAATGLGPLDLTVAAAPPAAQDAARTARGAQDGPEPRPDARRPQP